MDIWEELAKFEKEEGRVPDKLELSKSVAEGLNLLEKIDGREYLAPDGAIGERFVQVGYFFKGDAPPNRVSTDERGERFVRVPVYYDEDLPEGFKIS